MTNEKKKVILRAPLMTQSGYGVHSRQVARWLFDREDSRGDIEVYTNPLMWGVTPWLVNTESHNGLIGRIVQSAKKVENADVSFQLQLPNEWDPFLANYNIGMTAAVETDRCNPEWVACVNKMDLVVVPSQFVKDTICSSGEVTTDIVVVPECFYDEVVNDSVLDLPEVDTEFNFLVFGQFTGNNPENDRKNLAYTLKWLAEEFRGNKDVGVIVKTNFGRNTTIDRQKTIQVLGQLLLQVQQDNGPKFYLLHGDMENEELTGLYKNPKVKALVSLTRGEGFGLPLLEAAACGLPVVATGHSAHTEFLGLGKYIKVDYRLGPVHQSRIDGKIFMEGVNWAHPDEKDAKRKLSKFYKSPSIPMDWAKDLQEKLLVNYSYESIQEKYNNLLDEVLEK